MTDVQELRVVVTVPDFDGALRLYRDALGLDTRRGPQLTLLTRGE